MQLCESEKTFQATGPRIFATTHWSVVMDAGNSGSERSHRALETLCGAYWQPIYVYVRRKGHAPGDAQDLTQEFFAQLIAKERLRLADQSKGKFRSFLLANLDYFLAREWSRAHRQKRGGRYQFISLDEQIAENDFQFEAPDRETPEKTFQRRWALTVLKQTMTALEQECALSGKRDLFREVKHLLSGERDGAKYAAIAERLSMTETAVRVAVHRLRQRYGELLRAEIAQTVDNPAEVEDELRCLVRALTE